ncbi:hypothetical protein WDW86_17355 [Bdellovibrionota bacterium FG-2]
MKRIGGIAYLFACATVLSLSVSPAIFAAETGVPLSENELKAIREYTLLDYRWINSALRNETKIPRYEVLKVKGLIDGLQKLPDYRGEVYRCDSLPDTVFSQHIAGSILLYAAFTSTGRESKPWLGCTHSFIIQSIHGKSIERYSAAQGERRVQN